MNIDKNVAFRRGFLAGFSSPYSTVFGRVSHYSVGPRDLVTLSWQQVGKSVRDALDKEKVAHGEVARSSSER